MHQTVANKPRLAAFGELLMRLNSPPGKRLLRTDSLELSFGGAEANVCVLLSRLGMPAGFITRLPDNDMARAAIDQLRSNGVDTSAVMYGGDKMGLYFTEQGHMLRPGKVIYDRQHSAFASLSPGMIPWNEIFARVDWFHWSGISPALSQTAAAVCWEALLAAKEKGVTVSADFNHRSTLWKYGRHPSELMPELLSYCDVLVADPDAVRTYLGIHSDHELPEEERFRTCVEAMQQKLPGMKTLAMSFRGTGVPGQPTYKAALFYKQACYFTTSHTLPIVIDRIGSGDAFTAGLIYALCHEHHPQSIIDFALACGILKHSIQGDFALLSKEEVTDYLQHGPTGRIIR
ncbi:MAG TPA: sugar kinase [Puia sp.]|nr:sugar kinase [Puia sp.]